MSQDVGAVDTVEMTRATLAYNQVEDRISLTCAFNNDKFSMLWLTARLASHLVQHLRNVLAQSPEAPYVSVEREAAGNGAPVATKEQDKNQSAGATCIAENVAPEAPVIAEAGSASWVVTAIDITSGPMLIQLSFRNDQGHTPALLPLEHTQLAQWLEGLRHCYKQACWPMECWHVPTSAGAQSMATRRVALH
ncbi:MAG: hypothetical protein P8L39_04355 [Halioglobus sp.]|nr:hypothetical protein [Halioglobus sp.]